MQNKNQPNIKENKYAHHEEIKTPPKQADKLSLGRTQSTIHYVLLFRAD
jgi:hypothetical protein